MFFHRVRGAWDCLKKDRKLLGNLYWERIKMPVGKEIDIYRVIKRRTGRARIWFGKDDCIDSREVYFGHW